MPTQQELNDILLRQRLIDQETGNARAMMGRAGLPLPGPITPEQLQALVAQSQMRQRMGTDPQAARFRKMLANPAQKATDPYADTEADVARKAALARMALIPGGKRVPADSITPGQMADYKGTERARYRPDSEFMQQRRIRNAMGADAAFASRAKSANLAFRRGVLRPGAESAYAEQGVIPDRMAQAVAARVALAQALQPKHAGGNPIQAAIAADPAAMAAIKRRLAGGDESPAPAPDGPAPGNYPISGGTMTVLPGGGTIKRRKRPIMDIMNDAYMNWGDYINSANAASGPARGF